jgi:hypothetical protein
MTAIRSAQETLCSLNSGATMNEIAQALYDASQSVKDTNKAAKVTIEITVKPVRETRLKDHPINMTAKVTTKLPQELPATLYFVDDKGPTTQSTPRQPSLTGIGPADAPTGEQKHG